LSEIKKDAVLKASRLSFYKPFADSAKGAIQHVASSSADRKFIKSGEIFCMEELLPFVLLPDELLPEVFLPDELFPFELRPDAWLFEELLPDE
jgi:hypothetical protein